MIIEIENKMNLAYIETVNDMGSSYINVGINMLDESIKEIFFYVDMDVYFYILPEGHKLYCGIDKGMIYDIYSSLFNEVNHENNKH